MLQTDSSSTCCSSFSVYNSQNLPSLPSIETLSRWKDTLMQQQQNLSGSGDLGCILTLLLEIDQTLMHLLSKEVGSKATNYLSACIDSPNRRTLFYIIERILQAEWDCSLFQDFKPSSSCAILTTICEFVAHLLSTDQQLITFSDARVWFGGVFNGQSMSTLCPSPSSTTVPMPIEGNYADISCSNNQKDEQNFKLQKNVQQNSIQFIAISLLLVAFIRIRPHKEQKVELDQPDDYSQNHQLDSFLMDQMYEDLIALVVRIFGRDNPDHFIDVLLEQDERCLTCLAALVKIASPRDQSRHQEAYATSPTQTSSTKRTIKSTLPLTLQPLPLFASLVKRIDNDPLVFVDWLCSEPVAYAFLIRFFKHLDESSSIVADELNAEKCRGRQGVEENFENINVDKKRKNINESVDVIRNKRDDSSTCSSTSIYKIPKFKPNTNSSRMSTTEIVSSASSSLMMERRKVSHKSDSNSTPGTFISGGDSSLHFVIQELHGHLTIHREYLIVTPGTHLLEKIEKPTRSTKSKSKETPSDNFCHKLTKPTTSRFCTPFSLSPSGVFKNKRRKLKNKLRTAKALIRTRKKPLLLNTSVDSDFSLPLKTEKITSSPAETPSQIIINFLQTLRPVLEQCSPSMPASIAPIIKALDKILSH